MKLRLNLLAIIFSLIFSLNLQAEQVYKIGVSLPLSGPVADYGTWLLNGIKIAEKELNSNNNIKFKFIVEDDKCSPKEAVSTVKKLLTIDKVNKLIVFCTSVAGAVAPITKNKALVITPSFKTLPLNNPEYTHYFSLQPKMKNEMRVLADYVKNKGYKSVSIIVEENDFFGSYADFLKEHLDNYNINVSNIEYVLKESTDVKAQLLKIKSDNPDALFIGASPLLRSIIIKQKHSIKLNSQIINNWAFQDPRIFKSPKKAIEGSVYTYHYKKDLDENTLKFSKDYEEEYKEEANAAASGGYDIAMIYKRLIEECPKSKIKCLINSTNNIKNYKGASGNITFEDRATTKQVILKKVTDLKFADL